MDWLEGHWTLVYCKEKIIYFKAEDATRHELQGIKKLHQLHPITASQMGKCIRKGCQIYAIQVGFANSKYKTPMLENISVVQDFMDVFLESITGLPPKQNMNFTIKLMTGAAPVS